MTQRKYKIKMITEIAMLSALASMIGIIDKIISSAIFPTIPGIKVGLANIIILITIIKYTYKESMLVVILKSIIVGLLFSGLITFIISLIATLLSFIAMSILYYIYKNKINIITISIIGGFIHINSQLITISIIYNIGKEIYLYGIILILFSFVSSIIIGFLTIKLKNIDIIKQSIN